MKLKLKLLRKLLNISQSLNNKLYDKYGLNDDVLNNQLKINKIRAFYDVEDDKTIITDDGFLQ